MQDLPTKVDANRIKHYRQLEGNQLHVVKLLGYANSAQCFTQLGGEDFALGGLLRLR